MSRKVDNWRDKYKEYIHSKTDTLFDFGEHDCCITCCDVVKEVIGVDPAINFRGKYSGPIEALKLLKNNNGVEGIAEEAFEECGFKEIPPLMASRMDVVLVDSGGGRMALGWIDLDPSKIIVVSNIGFGELPITAALRAWRVK